MAEEQDHIQTAIRLPKSLLARIDKLATAMAKEGIGTVTRSDVHRHALEQGIAKLETGRKKK
jgi:predicted transcriptional regulator